jgi:hypothetical protein
MGLENTDSNQSWPKGFPREGLAKSMERKVGGVGFTRWVRVDCEAMLQCSKRLPAPRGRLAKSVTRMVGGSGALGGWELIVRG